MKIGAYKNKTTTNYYLQKTVREGKKTKTIIVEKLGTHEDLLKICGDMEPLEWARNYAVQKTAEEKEQNKDVIVKFSTKSRINLDVRNSCNVGYLFLRDIYYSLGLNKICDSVSKKHKFEYNLNDILSMLVYARVIAPGSKLSSLESAKKFLEPPKCELHQIYRALEVIAKENDFIQSELYKNSQSVIKRNKEVLYYDCTNFYFEIEEEDDFRKYGVSKEHRPNPIVQMGMFMDANGIPLSFTVFEGNQNEQPSMAPLEKKIIRDFEASKFVVCTDAGLSSTTNRKFNSIQGRGFVTTQSIKKLRTHLKEFCLEDGGWHIIGSKKIYKLSELNDEEDYNKVFYKERWTNEDGFEQRLIVTFSLKYKKYERTIRERQIGRADKSIQNPSSITKKRANDPKRFIEQQHCTEDGEIANQTIFSLNQEQIAEESKYDGLYAICTNLQCDIPKILKINQNRWEIEECFRIMKNEFKARPVFVQRKDKIKAHFTTCFIALVVYRILEQKLAEKFTCEELIKTLRSMNMLIIPGEGYIPEYTRTTLTDALQDTFGFRTDYKITTQQNMRKILNKTKKK